MPQISLCVAKAQFCGAFCDAIPLSINTDFYAVDVHVYIYLCSRGVYISDVVIPSCKKINYFSDVVGLFVRNSNNFSDVVGLWALMRVYISDVVIPSCKKINYFSDVVGLRSYLVSER